MPTIHWPAAVRVPLICLRRASAGGQLEQPSEVKSSTRTTFGRGAEAWDLATGVGWARGVACAREAATPVSSAKAMPAALQRDGLSMIVTPVALLAVRRSNRSGITASIGLMPGRMVAGAALLSDAECGEDEVEDVVGGGFAGEAVDVGEGGVGVEREHCVGGAAGHGFAGGGEG